MLVGAQRGPAARRLGLLDVVEFFPGTDCIGLFRLSQSTLRLERLLPISKPVLSCYPSGRAPFCELRTSVRASVS